MLNRNNLEPNNWVKGPLIVKENTSITVIDTGQKVMSNEFGLMVIKKENKPSHQVVLLPKNTHSIEKLLPK